MAHGGVLTGANTIVFEYTTEIKETSARKEEKAHRLRYLVGAGKITRIPGHLVEYSHSFLCYHFPARYSYMIDTALALGTN